LGQKFEGILGIVQVKYKRYEKLAFFGQYLALFRKRYEIHTAIVTMEDEYKLVCDLSNTFSMTFNGPLPKFQGHDILNVKKLENGSR